MQPYGTTHPEFKAVVGNKTFASSTNTAGLFHPVS